MPMFAPQMKRKPLDLGLYGDAAREQFRTAGGFDYNTPPIHSPETTIPQMDVPQMEVPAPKPGFNDAGGWGEKLGKIGAILQASAGNPAGEAMLQQYHQQSLMEARQKQEQAQYQRQRQDGMADWMAKEEWQRKNPAPEKVGETVVQRDPQTGEYKVIYAAPQQKSENERMIEAWSALPDSDPRKPMFARAIRGSAYDPTVYQPKIEAETAGRLRVKTTAPGKAPSVAKSSGSAPKAAKLPAGFILD